jgi:hypothetical protein
MLGFPVLDVAIGLIFIFLLLSLAVTAANELLASWLKRRSATLWRGVVQLLGGKEMAEQVYSHPLIAGMSDERRPRLRRGRPPAKRNPSYIPSRTFALALLHTLVPPSLMPRPPGAFRDALAAGLPNDERNHLTKSLTVLFDDAGGDVEEFKKNIEVWFNNAMERVSGWYKRRTQWVLTLMAIVVTVSMNVDTISIANTLWRDPAMRSALVAQAERFAEQERKELEASEAIPPRPGPPEPPDRLPYESAEEDYASASERFRESMTNLEGLAIPLGWRDRGSGADTREDLPRTLSDWGNAGKRHLLGWLLTALAISLGAPFWFDTLNKVIAIRAAGKAPEEKPKPPKKVPAPVEPGGEPAAGADG